MTVLYCNSKILPDKFTTESRARVHAFFDSICARTNGYRMTERDITNQIGKYISADTCYANSNPPL